LQALPQREVLTEVLKAGVALLTLLTLLLWLLLVMVFLVVFVGWSTLKSGGVVVVVVCRRADNGPLPFASRRGFDLEATGVFVFVREREEWEWEEAREDFFISRAEGF
jgi:hypothetical protein